MGEELSKFPLIDFGKANNGRSSRKFLLSKSGLVCQMRA